MRVVRNTTRACSMLHPASHAGRGDTLEESCCRTCRRLRTSGSVRRPLNRACGSRAPARAHTHAQRASERARRERAREREREGERTFERARESARILPQMRPAHHIVSARQAYAHLPCFLRPGYPLPPRPSETLQRRPRRGRAPTPPAQAPHTPQRMPPATARPGPAYAAAPAAAPARPAPHSPAPNSMGRKGKTRPAGERLRHSCARRIRAV